MMNIIYAVAVLGILGGVFGAVLAFAAKIFYVEQDERIDQIVAVLPGANCGGCGFAGCDDYAAALAADHTIAPNMCAPGGAAAAAGIAAVLGVDAGDSTPKVARVHCTGADGVHKKDMEYQGYSTCAAAKGFFGGPGQCKNGCIGFGDCVAVCKYGAIQVVNGVAWVDKELCVACGACAKACPQALIKLVPQTSRVWVGCSSTDHGKITRQVCDAGCIGCKLCEKACKFEAIKVENNHAVIDTDKCKNCGLCAKACPRHIIHVIPRKPVAPKAAPAPAPAPAAEAPKAEEAKAE